MNVTPRLVPQPRSVPGPGPRLKAKPLRGRYASLDPRPDPQDSAGYRGAVDDCARPVVRREPASADVRTCV